MSCKSLPKLTPRQLAVNQLVNASRILAYHGIADDLPGHISVRDPLSPDATFLITGGTGPAAHVSPADIAVARINDSVVTSPALEGFPLPLRPAEVFIHSSIYERFPNTTVSCIAFYRAEQLIPWSLFSTSQGNDTSPEATTGDLNRFFGTTSGTAFMGPYPAPVFSVFDAEPNTTSVAVDNAIKGYALAERFGPLNTSTETTSQSNGFRPLVLLRNDGATVVGTSVPETVFRFVQAAKSARVQYHSVSLATASGSMSQFLPATATKLSDEYLRSWLLWMSQIERSLNADSVRSPELWQGSGGNTPATSDNQSGGAAGRPVFTFVSSSLIFCIALTHAMLALM